MYVLYVYIYTEREHYIAVIDGVYVSTWHPKTSGVWVVFALPGPKACQQCPAGTAANNYGQTECQECNFGYRTYSSRFLDQLEQPFFFVNIERKDGTM